MINSSITAPTVALMIASTMPAPRMDAKFGQQPTADEGSQDSNDKIADDSEPGASHDLTGQPSEMIRTLEMSASILPDPLGRSRIL